MDQTRLKPIVKWVGGKRQLINDILPMIGSTDLKYVEPFVGGGAIFFALQPKSAIISDYNEELINLYEVVRDDPYGLVNELSIHKANNSKEYFYSVREEDRSNDYHNYSKTKKVARMIYLNKTCYNGLYRVNSKGFFNVPYGNIAKPLIVDKDNILSISDYLNSNDITIRKGDYKEVLSELSTDCFVFLDPPYYPLSSTANFTRYTKNDFGIEEQIILRDECNKLREKGIRFIQTNSDCDEIRELYKDYLIKTVNVTRKINSDPKSRRGTEVIIYYE